MLTAQRLRELLHYDPVTGIFHWRIAVARRVKVGDIAGSVHRDGYRQIMIDGRRYYAHHLAWLYVHGEWPPSELDHINGVPDDNRIANLRLATPSQNQWNQGNRKNNTSGFKGVGWHRRRRWRAQIGINGRYIHLGYFATPEEAHQTYCAAAKERFGEFTRAA
jgi:hypothetical protein